MPPLSNWNTPLVSPRHKQGEGSLVVQRETVRIDLLARGLLDQGHHFREDRQVAQAEEVHLQEAGPLHVAHGPLGDDFFLVLHALQGHVVGQRAIGDHHRRGVRAHVAGQALDLHGQVEQFADFGIAVVDLFQVVAFLQRLGEGDVQFVGHQGHDGVDAGDGHSQGPAHVADRRPGRQRAERADLRHVVHAVLVFDVLDHFAAALLAEVDVDIGRFPPALVQKPLEQQIVFQRANVAQMQGVGDQRADAGATRRGPNPLLAGEAHEIPHDQK